MAIIKDCSGGEFRALVSHGVVLADFSAPWCTACEELGKLLEQAAPGMGGDVVIARINVENAPELAAQYQIMTLPRLLVFRDGVLVKDFSGVPGLPKILAAAEEAGKA